MPWAIIALLTVAFLLGGAISTSHADEPRSRRHLPVPSALLAEPSARFSRPAPAAPSAPPTLFSPRPEPPSAERAHHRRRPLRPVIVAPSIVSVAPPHCWIPGSWTHQWVPVASPSQVWVPGQWTVDGRWIPGHYTTIATGGYWQPIWTPDAWVC